METYIQLYKNKTKHPKRWMVALAIMATIGFVGIVHSLVFGAKKLSFINDSVYFVFLFNGIGLMWSIKYAQKQSQYFFSWNDTEMNYLLLNEVEPTKICYSDISSITFTDDIATVALKNGESKRVNLNLFYHPYRDQITDFLKTKANSSF